MLVSNILVMDDDWLFTFKERHAMKTKQQPNDTEPTRNEATVQTESTDKAEVYEKAPLQPIEESENIIEPPDSSTYELPSIRGI